MIVNEEIKDLTVNGQPVLNEYGQCRRFICISYVDEDEHVKYYTHVIPDDWMYQWKYAKRNDTPDPVFKSWDSKDVVKEPIYGNFTPSRMQEIILDLQRLYPDDYALNMLDKLHIPKTAFVDIEVDVDDNGFPNAVDAKNTINTVSFVYGEDAYVLGLAPLTDKEIKWIEDSVTEHCKNFDTKYKFHYRYHANEESLLNDLLFNFMKGVDCITGWNFFGYDWPYIYNRCKKYYPIIHDRMKEKGELSPTGSWYMYRPTSAVEKDDNIFLPTHKCMYDYMEIYKKWDRIIHPKESNKLDWVAERCLGVKKVVHQLGFQEMWAQQKKEYVFYNAIDSILVREIDNKLKTSSAFFGLANIMHTPALTAFSSTKSIEIVQAEYLYKEGKVFPSVKKPNVEKEDYEGAYVFDPIPGCYRNILTLDFASLYPTTIRQFNISPDTLLFKDINYVSSENDIKTANGCVYTKEFDGFIPKILTDYYAKRKAYKKQMIEAQTEKFHLEEILERRKKESKIA